MKGGLEGRFESLIGQRFQQRDRQLGEHLLGVKREHCRRGILTSSITVAIMDAELEREFEGSAAECAKTLSELMESRPTALLVPRKRKVVRLCSDALLARRVALEATCQAASATIAGSLSSSMIAPHRTVSESFVQLQTKNACVELQTRQRELFWSKLKRMKPGAGLVAALVAGLVAAMSYLGRSEIADVWNSSRGDVEKAAQEAGEGSGKAVPGTDA